MADARARLHDAEAFLETAEMATDPDVIATNAVHSAIAAADAISCMALRERSADADHRRGAELLSLVDPALAAALKRCLDRKTQAAYESRDVSVSDATASTRQAAVLVAAARQRVLEA